MSPLQKLDEAIRDYFHATGNEGTLNGWALSYQSSFIDTEWDEDEDPIRWDSGYTLSPGLSPFTAAGMATQTSAEIRKVYLSIHQGEDG